MYIQEAPCLYNIQVINTLKRVFFKSVNCESSLGERYPGLPTETARLWENYNYWFPANK